VSLQPVASLIERLQRLGNEMVMPLTGACTTEHSPQTRPTCVAEWLLHYVPTPPPT